MFKKLDIQLTQNTKNYRIPQDIFLYNGTIKKLLYGSWNHILRILLVKGWPRPGLHSRKRWFCLCSRLATFGKFCPSWVFPGWFWFSNRLSSPFCHSTTWENYVSHKILLCCFSTWIKVKDFSLALFATICHNLALFGTNSDLTVARIWRVRVLQWKTQFDLRVVDGCADLTRCA